ncbi:hypothetical protein BC943DRAFT_329134 [Umbelopsis sp. AD052]|nr:hypothetical protein BC943DRAFT_329134 [Umbelopsis sp. AD052]
MPSKALYLLAIAAGSSVATAATNCNPSYNATTSPTCIANCNKKAGQGLWADWTDDPTSTNFVKSLSFQCEKGTPNYMAFMTSAGVCMTSCSTDDQSAFKTEFQQACQWYTSHTNDTCSGTSATTSSTSGASALQVTSLVVVCSLIASLGFM